MDLDGHLLWDNHTYCAPEPGTATIEQLDRHRRAPKILRLGQGSAMAQLLIPVVPAEALSAALLKTPPDEAAGAKR